MYEHIKTHKIYTMPRVGTLCRNDGYGSRLVKVVEVVKDQVLLETYGLLNRGRIQYPSRHLQRFTGKIVPRMARNGYAIESTNPNGWGKYGSNASYTPVDIRSHFYDAADIFEKGRAYARTLKRYHTRWPSNNPPSMDDHLVSKCGEWGPFGGTIMEQTYLDGVAAELGSSH